MSDVFQITELSGHRALVTGTGSQRCVLDTTERDELFSRHAHDMTDKLFEADVKNFFKPLTRAVDRHERMLSELHRQLSGADDPVFRFVVSEEVKGAEGKEEVLIILGHDSAVLRLIEAGQTDRLVWVGDDRIEITKYDPDDVSQLEEAELSDQDRESIAEFFNGLASELLNAGQQEPEKSDEPEKLDELDDNGDHDR